jgi:DNA-directed RNA polymerase specialized sigma54-like protein
MAVVERMRAVREVIAGVDPGGLSARDAEELLAESVALSNAAQALAARAALRAERSQSMTRPRARAMCSA